MKFSRDKRRIVRIYNIHIKRPCEIAFPVVAMLFLYVFSSSKKIINCLLVADKQPPPTPSRNLKT